MDGGQPELGTAAGDMAAGGCSWVERRFLGCLAAIGAGALALRIVFVVHQRWNLPLQGDAWFFHTQARLLSTGHGFINPASLRMLGVTRQSADHPPLYTLFLAALDLLGLQSPRSQLLTQCVIGTATVIVLGLVGRRIGGAHTGLVAAAIAATYPPLWVNDGMLVSESLFLLVVAVVLYFVYRYWESRSTRDAIVVGALIGVATLVRAEALLLVPLVLIPMVIRATRGESRASRARMVVGVAAVAVVVISPWVVFNLARFERPMLLSADGITLSAGNCDSTYHGPFLGYYDLRCVRVTPLRGPALERYFDHHDQSVDNAEQRARAFHYMRVHLDEVPGVVLTRIGRVWQIARVDQTRRFDIEIEGRDHYAVNIGFWYTYALFPLSVAGAVFLVRRRVPILPLAMLIVVASTSAAMALGVLRYRAIAEPALVLLAATAVASVLRSVTNRGRDSAERPS